MNVFCAASSSVTIDFTLADILCFHSRGQYLCKFTGTKESVCIRKEFNSHRTGLGHKHGRRFIVLGHKYGRHDVMWKHTIKLESSEPVVGFRSYWHFLLECEFKNMPISQVYRFGPSSEYFYQLLSCMFQVRRILVIFTTNPANFQNPKNWVGFICFDYFLLCSVWPYRLKVGLKHLRMKLTQQEVNWLLMMRR